MKNKTSLVLLVLLFPMISMGQLDGVDKLIRLSYTDWRAVCETVNGEFFTKTVTTNDILTDNVCEAGSDQVDASGECLDEAKANLNSSSSFSSIFFPSTLGQVHKCTDSSF